MRSDALCSAQTTVFPRKMVVDSVEGPVCSGKSRIHNSKVVGSSPTPATDKINNLRLCVSAPWEFQPHGLALFIHPATASSAIV